MRLLFFFLFANLFLFNPLLGQSTYQLDPSVKRIVFIGNSITWQGDYVNYIEAFFRLHKSGQAVEIINVGLPSETVSGLSEEGHAGGRFPRPDLHERLTRVLDATKPDLVISCYGMNDGIYLPFSEERFEKFKAGILWLNKELAQREIPVIHVTPPIYDPQKGEAYANVLDIYSDWLISRRYTDDWEVIDLHWPMKKYLEEQRQSDSTFYLAKDGVHPNANGHWLMAKSILLYFGVGDVASAESVSEALAPFGKTEELLKLLREQQNISRDAWLRHTGHKRPGLPEGLTLEEAEEKIAEIERAIELLLR
ncbi:MAG: SGNH/GDSL hydrolase family protein [Bacteroidota bacterium]